MLTLVMLFLGYILSSDLFPVFTWFALEVRSNWKFLKLSVARGTPDAIRDALCGCLSQSGVESDHDQGTWIPGS